MTSGRVLSDIAELAGVLRERANTELSYDVQESSVVEVGHYTFPDGWTNKNGTPTGVIRFELPASYPETPPSVAIPADMRYRDRFTSAMEPTETWPPDGWVAFQPALEQWNPVGDGLLTVLAAIERRLRNPETDVT